MAQTGVLHYDRVQCLADLSTLGDRASVYANKDGFEDERKGGRVRDCEVQQKSLEQPPVLGRYHQAAEPAHGKLKNCFVGVLLVQFRCEIEVGDKIGRLTARRRSDDERPKVCCPRCL